MNNLTHSLCASETAAPVLDPDQELIDIIRRIPCQPVSAPYPRLIALTRRRPSVGGVSLDLVLIPALFATCRCPLAWFQCLTSDVIDDLFDVGFQLASSRFSHSHNDAFSTVCWIFSISLFAFACVIARRFLTRKLKLLSMYPLAPIPMW